VAGSGIVRTFRHDPSQAVRPPLALWLPGDSVRVRRVEGGLLLEPMVIDIDAWFAALDRLAEVPCMEEGDAQPPMPAAKTLSE
jgi:virulence-associated protein VagC